MKPMYFPFTHISETVAGALFRRLGPFSVCREVEEDSFCDAVASGRTSYIESVCPVAEDSGRIEALAKEYMKWGDLHRGDIAGLSRFVDNKLYHDEFSANISSQIKKGGDRKNEKDDPVFTARLFLCLAREFDIREDEFAHDIKAADVAGRSLVAELTGEPIKAASVTGFLAKSGPSGDPGEVATQMRLSAFFQLLCQYGRIPRLYVTSSRAVMGNLMDRFSGMTLLAGIDGVSMSGDGRKSANYTQPEWMLSLVNLAAVQANADNLRDAVSGVFPQGGSPQGCSMDGYHMEIYAIDSCPPSDFVSELAGLPCKPWADAVKTGGDASGLTIIFAVYD